MKLKDLLDDHQLYHSEFQQDYLITGKTGGTIYGQYKQALRELYKRTRGLREIISNRRRTAIDIEELKWKTENLENEFDRRRAQVDYDERCMLVEESERVLQDTKREFKRFYQHSIYLKGLLGDIDDERRKKLDEDMWEFKLKEMIVLDWRVHGRITSGTYEFLHSTPRRMKERIVSLMSEGQGKLIDWYETQREDFETTKFPEVEYNKEELLLLLEN